ncbi:hypothetical protein [Sphingobium sp. CFD-1]|uniref:hypothetical protein n=1 Tax=Sphingobium sp. CFD-1 TaxID=2878545 RepID=UPI00214BC9F6|nr:hypothetical protein [Sphingobium sp. CFD-1]
MSDLLNLAQRLEEACDMTGSINGRHVVKWIRERASQDATGTISYYADCIENEAKLFDDLAAVAKHIAAILRAESVLFRHELREMKAERDLLQEILDGRPAINAGLPDSYIRWSQSIYSGEMFRAIAARGKLQ